jgi:maleamate amidohydrolase
MTRFRMTYRVIIPEECVADRAEIPHRVNLFDMEMISADVLPLDDVLEHLRGLDRRVYANTV